MKAPPSPSPSPLKIPTTPHGPAPSEAPSAKDRLVIDGVSKAFGRGKDRVAVLENATLSIERGQFVSVIGPSGCGKTTMLRIVAGLLDVDKGEVSIFGEGVTRAIEAKHIGFVPQSPALLPWRSVLDNVRLPLQLNKRANEWDDRAAMDPVEVLTAFGLGHVLRRRPSELSGGMQQRVAIARAFVSDPPILLMDEPFAAVDELTRESLRYELLSIWQSNMKTVIFVTHSIPEAIALSDAVVVMSANPGRIQQIVQVPLPRPRGDLLETTAEFHELEDQVRFAIRAGRSHP